MSSCGHCYLFRGTKCPHCGTRVLTYKELEADNERLRKAIEDVVTYCLGEDPYVTAPIVKMLKEALGDECGAAR